MTATRVFVTNLGAYTRGELNGEWLNLPASDEAINALFERCEISTASKPTTDEEYFITDFESDFEICEFSDLRALNEQSKQIKALDDYKVEILNALINDGYKFDEALEKIDDCIFWNDCYTMADVAERYAEESGLLKEIPEELRFYFDFVAFGRDLEIEGHYIETENGFVEVC